MVDGANRAPRIFEACKDREAVLASRTLATHLSRTALTMLMMVAPDYDPAAIRNALQLVVGSGGKELALPERRCKLSRP